MTRRLLATFTVLLACNEGSTTPQSPPKAPSAVALRISPSNPTLKAGTEHTFGASKVFSNGSQVAVAPAWSSSNPGVLTIGQDGVAMATGAGVATVTAMTEGLNASTLVSVILPGGKSKAGPLIVEEFSVVEFQYPEQPPATWYYAPQLRVRSAPGRLLTIESIAFPQSAIGRFDWPCRTRVPDALAIDLNGESYGEWTFSVAAPYHLGSIEIVAVITYRDEKSVSATVQVEGPINAGTLPDYGSGAGPGACVRPYVPPG